MNSTKQNTPSNTLLHGDCLAHLQTMKTSSVDLVCTDPPYGIGFMGNAWDTFTPAHQRKALAQAKATHRPKNGRTSLKDQGAAIAGSYDHSPKAQGAFQEFIRATSAECLRVLKPGGLMFVTMTPRQDSLARVIVGMEDAGLCVGFTSLYWTFSSGFPKAHNIGKHIDRQKGVERKIIGTTRGVKVQDSKGLGGIARGGVGIVQKAVDIPLTIATSAEAKALDGSYGGFQPKPAVEVIIVAMKPLSEKQYLDQARKDGKGITWLDDCRIPGEAVSIHDAPAGTFAGGPARGSAKNYRPNTQGRFPANLLVSDDALGDYSRFFSLDAWEREKLPFLIVPKAGKREKNPVARPAADKIAPYASKTDKVSSNTHPTVKPLKLMSYLITLGSRPGDLVLDPFLGSGTTAVAAKLLGRRYVGIEREREYLAIARSRIAAISAKSGS